ncbi:MAG: hypothetical protein HQ541_00525 [Mariniphaga sp.]|nr:hypothetical protein [Mariniphaga sp.]
MDKNKSNQGELKDVLNDLEQVKIRLAKVEKSLEKQKKNKIQTSEKTKQPETEFELNLPFQSKGSIEFRLGEYGMAWLGNIVLLFGITFLVQYLQNAGNLIISMLVGFISVFLIYAGSFLTRTSYSYLSKLLEYNGHLLLYYFTLRLHFFQDEPIIGNKIVGIIVLMLVLVNLLYISFRKKSQLLAGIILLMILVSGVISNSTQFFAGITAITALVAIIFYYRFGWVKLVFIFIFLTYLAHITWLLNNPFIGNNPEFIESPGTGYFFLIATGFIFSLLALIPKKENISKEFIITSVIWNGLGFTFILILTIVTYFSKNYVSIFAVITVFCIAYAFILQSRSHVKITASMYALYGFLAMSVSFHGIYGLPQAYMLLSIQSLLVVSMALWFRSRFIVIMNTVLFIVLLIFYLKDSSNLNTTNFSFILIAFITARIINWKKERLNIQTEYVRNLYLISGLIMMLIALHHAIPESYITVSWMVAAIFLFLLSLLIKNVKYRWLAITTMIITGIKLIIIDMSNIDIGYRVLVFLFLAIISITVSIFYTRYLQKKRKLNE